jgi:acyl-coenzyme A thioesterase PaaI-like protein
MTTSPDTETGQPGSEPAGPRRERTFSWTDPVTIVRAAASMSGAEFFAAYTEGKIPPLPIMRALDFDSVSFGEGSAAFRLTPREFHGNPLGTVHGGVLATLLDTARGCAVQTMLPAGVLCPSLDQSVFSREPPGSRSRSWAGLRVLRRRTCRGGRRQSVHEPELAVERTPVTYPAV